MGAPNPRAGSARSPASRPQLSPSPPHPQGGLHAPERRPPSYPSPTKSPSEGSAPSIPFADLEPRALPGRFQCPQAAAPRCRDPSPPRAGRPPPSSAPARGRNTPFAPGRALGDSARRSSPPEQRQGRGGVGAVKRRRRWEPGPSPEPGAEPDSDANCILRPGAGGARARPAGLAERRAPPRADPESRGNLNLAVLQCLGRTQPCLEEETLVTSSLQRSVTWVHLITERCWPPGVC